MCYDLSMENNKGVSQMSGKLTITNGLPGSGKSTWAEEQIVKDPENTVRANRDDIRTSLFGESYHKGKFPKKEEGQVTQVQERIIKENLAKGKHVISDDTNLNTRTISSLVRIAHNYNAEIHMEPFNVPVAECKRRNAKRASEGGRDVPDFVIDGMAKNGYSNDGNIKEFIVSKTGVVSAVDRQTRGMKHIEEFDKKMGDKYPINGKAVVILDMDGSLFNNERDAQTHLGGNKRNFPAFYKSIEQASANQTVLNMVNKMRDHDGLSIVALTGRSDDYARELITAINNSGAKISRLMMKREGDFRPSNEHKSESVDKLRDEGFVVVHAIDDRAQDLQMFASKGIMTTIVEKPILDPNNLQADHPEPGVNTAYGSGTCIRCGSKLKDPNKSIGDKCRTKM